MYSVHHAYHSDVIAICYGSTVVAVIVVIVIAVRAGQESKAVKVECVSSRRGLENQYEKGPVKQFSQDSQAVRLHVDTSQ